MIERARSARRRSPLWLACLGAVSLVAAVAQAASVGTVRQGTLDGGYQMPLEGPYHRFWEPVRERGTNHATLEVAALVLRAARTVELAFGGPELVIGDMSRRHGGDLYGHFSHNAGRDVDLLPFRRDAGRPVRAERFVRFDDRGRVRGTRLTFDVERNWQLIKVFVTSRYPAVQYVFVSRPLRRRLLAHAAARGEHPEVLRRARLILRQPRNAAAHDDHFHLRTYCSIVDLNAGCRDVGPVWPWVDAFGWAAPLPPPDLIGPHARADTPWAAQ